MPGGLGLLAVAPDDLRGFLHQQAQHGPAQATRATQLYAVKALYAYAASEGFRLENPAHGLKLSVRGRIRTEVYTRPEADRILSWAGGATGPPVDGRPSPPCHLPLRRAPAFGDRLPTSSITT